MIENTTNEDEGTTCETCGRWTRLDDGGTVHNGYAEITWMCNDCAEEYHDAQNRG